MTVYYWLRRRAQYLWNALLRRPKCPAVPPDHDCPCRREAGHLGLHHCRCDRYWWRP